MNFPVFDNSDVTDQNVVSWYVHLCVFK